MFGFLKPRTPYQLAATKLYGSVVAQARQPAFYLAGNVPDTMEGRFEMIVLHLAIVIDRLRQSDVTQGSAQNAIATELTSVFVTDIDDNYREIGLSDTKVPAKVKKAAAVLYDRTLQYRELAATGDTSALGQAFHENLRLSSNTAHDADDPSIPGTDRNGSETGLSGTGTETGLSGSQYLVWYHEAARNLLATQSDADLHAGKVSFPKL